MLPLAKESLLFDLSSLELSFFPSLLLHLDFLQTNYVRSSKLVAVGFMDVFQVQFVEVDWVAELYTV